MGFGVLGFQGSCNSKSLWWDMPSDEIILQPFGALICLSYAVDGLYLFTFSSGLFKPSPCSNIQGLFLFCFSFVRLIFIFFSVKLGKVEELITWVLIIFVVLKSPNSELGFMSSYLILCSNSRTFYADPILKGQN